MSQETKRRRVEERHGIDLPTDTHMQTCANCDRKAVSAMSLACPDGSLFCRSVPLCAECLPPMSKLHGSDAGFGALVALCHIMTQRTGQEWIYGDPHE